MKSTKEICPSCGNNGISSWAWLYSSWPAYAKCCICNSKVRMSYPIWLGALSQLGSFMLILFGLINGANGKAFLSFILIFAGLLLIIAPAYFSKLEAVD
jgi:hypothetical protein